MPLLLTGLKGRLRSSLSSTTVAPHPAGLEGGLQGPPSRAHPPGPT